MPEQLPEGYHLENFLSLMRFVRHQYADLLTAEEREYADNFELLPQQSQSLYVRLILRKGPVFRSDKLSYADIDDIKASAVCLRDFDFIDQRADIDERIALHTKVELLRWLPTQTNAKLLKRPALLDLIRSDVDVLQQQLSFEIYRPLGAELILRYRLLFFGNLNQDFSEFVLTDMGMLRYENYSIDSRYRLFDSRAEVEQLWRHYQLREQCGQMIAQQSFQQLSQVVNDGLQLASGDMPTLMSLGRRSDRLRNYVARHLERQHLDLQALALYRLSSATPARERRVRLLKKHGAMTAGLALCEEMQASPIDEEELDVATRLGHALAMKVRGESQFAQVPLEYNSLSLQFDKPLSKGLRVEELVRRWFEDNTEADGQIWRSFYVENGLIPSLFGLCFWDIIFAPIKGAFVNPYQRGPLDLFTPVFLQAREAEVNRRFFELSSNAAIKSRALSSYQQKRGTANYLVRWDCLSSELLELALTCIPYTDLLVIFRRLLFDLRNNRSGFPDLICFNCDEKNGHSYLMVEVKGPGDKLQNNQKRWIKTFSSNEIPFQLAHVSWVANE